MKKIILTLVLSLIIISNVQARDNKIGSGELKLTEENIAYMHTYFQGKAPSILLVSSDGKFSTWWYCPVGQANCRPGNKSEYIKYCERKLDKIFPGNNSKCLIFAINRTIKWKTNDNPGKGKISRVSSKLTLSQFEDKLEDLGFDIGNNYSAKKKSKKSSNSMFNKYKVRKALIDINTYLYNCKNDVNLSTSVLEEKEELEYCFDNISSIDINMDGILDSYNSEFPPFESLETTFFKYLKNVSIEDKFDEIATMSERRKEKEIMKFIKLLPRDWQKFIRKLDKFIESDSGIEYNFNLLVDNIKWAQEMIIKHPTILLSI